MAERRKRTEKEKETIRERMKRYASYGYRMQMDINYTHIPAQFGEYKIVLTAGGQEFVKYASILRDHWYDK